MEVRLEEPMETKPMVYRTMKAKALFLIVLLSLVAGDVLAQGTIDREKKCPTCGKVISKCPYKGTHPATPPKPKPQAEEAGYDVTFSCNVPTAVLQIDGTAYGSASGTRFLKTGSHQVKITASGYHDWEEGITVNRQNRTCNATLIKKRGGTETIEVGNVAFKMVYVEGGTFTMGATAEQGSDADDFEKPAHSVTLSSYYIGQTEVTQALWEAVMGSNPSKFKGDNLPVEMVSSPDCAVFIDRLNRLTGKTFRLPTEAEWEYAARGGSKSRGYKYSGSDNIGSVAWYDGNSGKKTHAVASKVPNELGLYDMSGNVREWCQDWSDDYISSAQNNPTGPTLGAWRVIRGGCWKDGAGDCRVSCRYGDLPFIHFTLQGLRLVLVP